MERSIAPVHIFRFGLFEADASSGTLSRNGVRVKIQDQPFRMLVLLLERPGEVVTREELRQRLWPKGTYVDFDGSLSATLKKLRAAIDDDSDNPRFIETVPRRGYRFIAPVSVTESARLQAIKLTEDLSSSQAMSYKVPSSFRKRARFWWILAAVALMLPLAGSWWYIGRKSPRTSPSTRKVIAVLPFSNQGAGPDFDYLRFAIANELVTDLAHAHSVSVRPFASTSRYASQAVDLAAVGKELKVTHVLAGGFLLDKQGLRINLELVDVALNQPVWRDEVAASPQELVALHNRLAVSMAKGLLTAMNISNAPPDEMSIPKNEQALDLFLHSLSIPLDPEPNRLAIRKLEESVSLDSGYAPAWGELGWRYYLDFHYGTGDEAAITKSLQALKRQSELDPSTPSVWTNIRVEQGDLNGAYDQAAEFLRRRPDSSAAHFGMSYVLRYAGLLDQAGKECDAALTLDPGFNGLRSCAIPFIMAGDYAHAQRYIDLDERFGVLLRLRIALRTGNTAEILADYSAASQSGFRRADDYLALFRSCASHVPVAELVAKLEADPVSSQDAELLYQNAELMGFCGQGDAALRELRSAIKGNHCSYPAMDKDPLFDPIRQRPEFAGLRMAAVQCQQNFLAHRVSVDAALAATQ